MAGPPPQIDDKGRVRPATDRPTPRRTVTPPASDPFPTLSFRSTKRTADRLDALRPYLTESGQVPLVGTLTRADLLRLVVEEGLVCLERRARRRGATDTRTRGAE